MLQDGDDEPEKDVKARLGDLLPVKGTKTNFERGSGQTNKPKTPTTGGGNKHSLLHANVVGAHTPTAQTKDEIIVEKVIEKQSEENTDAESSEAIVAADVSKEAPATKEEVTSEDEDAEDIAEEEKEKADSEYASENAEELAVETAAANAIADAVIAESDEENSAAQDGETVDEKITKSAASKAAKFFANVKTRAKERFEKRAQEELAFYADYEDYEDDYGAEPDALTGDGYDSPADLVASGQETVEEAKEDIKDIEAEKAAIQQEKGMKIALEEIQATDLAEPTRTRRSNHRDFPAGRTIGGTNGNCKWRTQTSCKHANVQFRIWIRRSRGVTRGQIEGEEVRSKKARDESGAVQTH